MTWSFNSVDHKTYNRNPIVSTDVEVRFHPIVKIGKISEIATFQDKVRQVFPTYKENKVRGVTVGSAGDFSINDETEYVFSDPKRSESIFLSPHSIRINSLNHQNRKELIKNFDLGYKSLLATFGTISPLRLGVRYVNIIDIKKIGNDMGQELNWKDLIVEEFLKLPGEIADISNTSYKTEVQSNVKGGEGGLSLRYGLTQNQGEAPDHFRFDIDRFVELSDGVEDVSNLIKLFTQDIFSLFHTVAGKKLKEWMDS